MTSLTSIMTPNSLTATTLPTVTLAATSLLAHVPGLIPVAIGVAVTLGVVIALKKAFEYVYKKGIAQGQSQVQAPASPRDIDSEQAKKVAELEQQVATLTTQLKEAQSQHTVTELSTQVSQLKVNVNDLKSQFNESKRLNDVLKDENDGHLGKLKDQEQQISELKEQVQKLTKQQENSQRSADISQARSPQKRGGDFEQALKVVEEFLKNGNMPSKNIRDNLIEKLFGLGENSSSSQQ